MSKKFPKNDWNYLDCKPENVFLKSSNPINFPTVECFNPSDPFLVPKVFWSYHLMKLSGVVYFACGVTVFII